MPLRKLAAGFAAFREETFLPKRSFFEALAKKQEPKVMMIACCDSRVDPAILTKAEAGDIFMIRNVANLVPPYARDKANHGTSAALEFAVTSLEVEHIVVFGHSGCAGIKALLTADPALAEEHTFIHNWMNIIDEARRRTMLITRNRPLETQLHTLELEVIKTSLANLLTFPWIFSRVDHGNLHIHGWYFDITEGEIYEYLQEQDRFQPLTIDMVDPLQQQ
jgi:carbonic anhydrase